LFQPPYAILIDDAAVSSPGSTIASRLPLANSAAALAAVGPER
jgi:hypothetical protein